MTIIGKLTSTLLYTSAPISIITSIIISTMSFVNSTDCTNINFNLNNNTIDGDTGGAPKGDSSLYTSFCNNVDIDTLRQAVSILGFVWSSLIGLMAVLIKQKMNKLNDEKLETEKINVELVTETGNLKDKISTLSGATTQRSLQPFVLENNRLVMASNEPYNAFNMEYNESIRSSEMVSQNTIQTGYPTPNAL